MQFPKLTPLQSRFVVSLTASAILVVIYFFLWSPHFAYAAELGGTPKSGEVLSTTEANLGGNWARVAELGDWMRDWLSDDDDDDDDDDVGGEEVDSDLNKNTDTGYAQAEADQAVLRKRAESVSTLDGSNVPSLLNIVADETQVWIFKNSSLWGNYTDPGPGLPSDDYLSGDGADADVDTLFKRDSDTGAHLEKRQSTTSRRVYISINTCLQPRWNGSSPQLIPPPQLTLYVSNDTTNTRPGPKVTNDTQLKIPLQDGFANYSMNATTDVYMAVSAPAIGKNFSGVWNYELAVSIDDYYHGAYASSFLHLVDTDTENALLVTDNLTQSNPDDKTYQKWMNLTAPFIVFAQNTDDTSVWGLGNSFCGLKTTPAQIMSNADDPQGTSDNVQMSMITRGMGNKPKEQFYVKGLNASSNYNVTLAMLGNSTKYGSGVVGGGGRVWPPTNLKTKSDGNCQLIFSLDFCSEVAYAVPSNPRTFPSVESLGAVYDSYAAEMYQNFNYSLQQVPCNTTSSAQYSLAKTCDDCAAAYKQWLCAVTMPRCEDFSSTLSWLQPRNMAQSFSNSTASKTYNLDQNVLAAAYTPMTSAPGDSAAYSQTYESVFASNSSRNPAIIDQQIEPGPYKEVLPCADLCYSLVQSCPASLGFGCPTPGRGLELDYGQRSSNGTLTCSYLGAVYYLNDASVGFGARWSGGLAVAVAGVVGVFLLVV